ncbi:unnamed protein product [Gongylonema pulchrum]|uniref:Uncharacterized protein n=1 Tax=Gongylonema pulchrum TaxID=637853 RepID=A0A183CZ50_9BILA|nr:unnamed protein product [Gongylonema pulchrum]
MWNSARKLRSGRGITRTSSYPCKRTLFKHAEEITPLQNPDRHQQVLPHRTDQTHASLSTAAARQHTVPTSANPETAAADNAGCSYYRSQQLELPSKPYRKRPSRALLRHEKVLLTETEEERNGNNNQCDIENNNNLPQPHRAPLINGYLHTKPKQQHGTETLPLSGRSRWRSPIYCSSLGSNSSESVQVRKPCGYVEISRKNFSRRFGGLQRKPLVRQPAEQYFSVETSPRRHCSNSAALGYDFVNDYIFYSPGKRTVSLAKHPDWIG